MRLKQYHGHVVKLANEQRNIYQNQINLCNQMKLVVERYFGSLSNLQDETSTILKDW